MNPIECLLTLEKKIQRELKWKLLFETAEKVNLSSRSNREVGVENIDELVLNRSMPKNKSINKRNISFSTGTRIKRLHRSSIKRRKDIKRLCLKNFILEDLNKSVVEHDVNFSFDDLEHRIQNKGNISNTKSLDQVTGYTEGFPYRMNINCTYPQFNCDMKLVNGYQNSDKMLKRKNDDEEPQKKKRQRKNVSEVIANLTQNLNNSKVNYTNSSDYLDNCMNKLDKLEIDVSDVGPRKMGNNVYSHDAYHLSLNKMYHPKSRNVKKHKNLYDSDVTEIGNRTCELNSVNKNQMKVIRSPSPITIRNLGSHKDAIGVNSTTLDLKKPLKTMMDENAGVSTNCKGLFSDPNRITNEGIIPVNYKENPILDPDKFPATLRSAETAKASDSNQTQITPTTKSKKRKANGNPDPIAEVNKYKSKKLINSCKEILSSNCKQNHLVDSNQIPGGIKGAKTIIKVDEATTASDYKDELLDSNSARIKPTKKSKNTKAVRKNRKEIISLNWQENQFLDSYEIRTASGGANKRQIQEDKVTTDSEDKDELLDSNSSTKNPSKKSKNITALSEATKNRNLYDSGVTVDIGNRTCELNSVNKNQMKVIRSPSPITIRNLGSHKDAIDVNSTTLNPNKPLKTMMDENGGVSSNCKGLFSDPNRITNEGIIPVNYKENPILDTDKFPATLRSAETAKASDSNQTPITPTTKSKKRKAIGNFSKKITSNDSSPNEIISESRSAKNVIEEYETDIISDYNDGTINSNKITLTPEARSTNKRRNVTTEVVTILDCRNGSLDSNKSRRKPRAKAKNGVKAVRINRKDRISSSSEENLLFDSNKTRAGLRSGNAAMKGDKVTITSDSLDESLDSNPDPIAEVNKYKSKKLINSCIEMLSSNGKQNHLLDSNQIPAVIKGAKTIIKVDEATTASDYKDELLDSNSARIKPTKKSKNTKAVRNNRKEIISLNCQENQFLDSNEIRTASGGANKRQIQEDKVTTDSEDKDELLDSNSSTKNPSKKSKNITALPEATKNRNLYDSGVTVDIGNRTCELNSVNKNQMKVIRSPSPITIRNLGNHKDAIGVNSTTLNPNKPLKTMMDENGGVSSNCKGLFLDPNRITNEGIIPVNYKENPILDTDKFPATLRSAETAKASDSNQTLITPTTKSKKRKAIGNFSKKITSNDSSPNEIISESRSAKNVVEEYEADIISDYNDGTINSNKITLTPEARSTNKRRNVTTEVVTILDCRNGSLDSNKTPRTPRAKTKNDVKAVRINRKDRISSSSEENLLFDSNKTRAGLRSGNAAMKGDKVTITSDCLDESVDSNPAPIAEVNKYKSKKLINSCKEILSSNCKQNQIPGGIKGAKTIIKVDEATTASDYKDELLDPNAARIKPTKKSKNTKAVRNNRKEIISLNCQENQFLDSNEIRTASGGANKRQIQEDKVTTDSEDKDELLDSNSSTKNPSKKSKNITALSEATKNRNLYDSGVTVDIGNRTCELNSVNKNQMKVIRSPSPITIRNLGSHKDAIGVNSTTLDENKPLKTMMDENGGVSSNCKGVSSDSNKIINEGIIPVNYKENPILDTDKFPAILRSAETAKASDSNQTPITPTTKSKKRKAIGNFSKEITSNDSSPNEIISESRSAKNVIEEYEADIIADYNDGIINSSKITLTPEGRSTNKRRNVTTEIVTILDCRNGSLDSNKSPRKPRAKAKNGVKAVRINRKDRISSSSEENLLFDSNKTRAGLRSGNAAMKGDKVTITSDSLDESLDSNPAPIAEVNKYKSNKLINSCIEMLSSNCKQNHLVDSNQIPAVIKGAKTIIKVDEATTASDYKDELLDPNSARIKPTKASKNTKAVRNNRKEIISLNCQENQFLDSNENRVASGGANKRQIQVDKVTTDSDDNDELLDSNSSTKKPTKRSKKTKTIKNCTKEILPLNCKKNQFLDSNEIRVASGGANKRQIKEDKVTTDSDDKDEVPDSNTSTKNPSKKSKATKTVNKRQIKENKVTTDSDNKDEVLDSNTSTKNPSKKSKNTKTVNKRQIKENKVTTDSDDKAEVLDSNTSTKNPSKKSKNTKTVNKRQIKENKVTTDSDDKAEVLDSNTSTKNPSKKSKATKTVNKRQIKENKVTTDSDDKDELLDSNTSTKNPSKKSKTTKTVKNSKEMLPLNCKENQSLDSTEIPVASAGGNKRQIKEDKVTTDSDDKDELLDSSSTTKNPSKKSKTTKTVKNSKEMLPLNCKENQSLDSTEIPVASAGGNKRQIKEDKVTTDSDDKDELLDSNSSTKNPSKKSKTTKTVKNNKEILPLNCKENQFLDSNEIRAAPARGNKRQIKEDKVTTDSDDKDELLDSNSTKNPTKKSKNAKTIKNSSKEMLSLNSKENQFSDSNKIRGASSGANIVITVGKVTTIPDYKDEVPDSKSAPIKPTKKSKNAKTKIKFSNRKVNHFLDSNKNLVTLTSTKAVTKGEKAAATSDFNGNKNVITPTTKSKTRNAGRVSTEEDVISPNCKPNHFLNSDEIPTILTRAKTAVKGDEVATTSNDKNENLDLNESGGKRSVKSKNVKARRTSRKLVSNKSSATATSVETVTNLDSNKTRMTSTTKLKSMEVTRSNEHLNLNSNATKLINTEISSSSNNNGTSNLQGTMQTVNSPSDFPTYPSQCARNKTEDLIKTFARNVSFKEVNFASDTDNTDHKLCLSTIDEEFISTYLKETNDPCKYEDLLRIVNFVEQRSPQITNYILAMRVLEALGQSRSSKYRFLREGVKEGISTLSKFLRRRCFETYIAYALWLYELKRKT